MPGAGAVTVTWGSEGVPATPSIVHCLCVMGADGCGVDVSVNVTGVPEITGFGVQSKSAVGYASATPAPSGDTTAPAVAKQAVSRSLTGALLIRLTNVGVDAPLAVHRPEPGPDRPRPDGHHRCD
jgi:hypothetical protein